MAPLAPGCDASGMSEGGPGPGVGRRVWSLFTPHRSRLVLVVLLVLLGSGLGSSRLPPACGRHRCRADVRDHPDRRDPVPAGQRRRRGEQRADVHVLVDPVELGHGDRGAGRDAAAVLAADPGVGGGAAAVRPASGPGRSGATTDRQAHAGVPVGHDGDHRGVAVGVGHQAVQAVRSAGPRGAAVPAGEPATDRPAGAPGDVGAEVLRRRAGGAGHHACAGLPRRRHRPAAGHGHHRGDGRRVHHPPDETVVPTVQLLQVSLDMQTSFTEAILRARDGGLVGWWAPSSSSRWRSSAPRTR